MDSSELSDEKAKHIAYLVSGFITDTLSPAEMTELAVWVSSDKHNSLLFEQLIDPENIKKMNEEAKDGLPGNE